MVGDEALARMDSLLSKLENLPEELQHIGEDILETRFFKLIIVEMNQEQLARGKRADDSEIDPYYTRETVRRKKEKGQETDFVNLRDKGNFYRGIRTSKRREGIEVEGTDSKTQDLEDKYNEGKSEILGLNDYNTYRLTLLLFPKFSTKVKEYFAQ